MIDLALGINVLTRAYHHGVGRGHVNQGRLAWVCVGHPYRDGEAVGCAAEQDGYCAREMEEEGGGAVGEGYEPLVSWVAAGRKLGCVLWTSVLGDSDGYCDSAWATSLYVRLTSWYS